jgi:hypothetical protein
MTPGCYAIVVFPFLLQLPHTSWLLMEIVVRTNRAHKPSLTANQVRVEHILFFFELIYGGHPADMLSSPYIKTTTDAVQCSNNAVALELHMQLHDAEAVMRLNNSLSACYTPGICNRAGLRVFSSGGKIGSFVAFVAGSIPVPLHFPHAPAPQPFPFMVSCEPLHPLAV